jgi:hypothetical protein
MNLNSGRMRLILNTFSIPIIVSSLILVAGFSYQSSAGQSVPSGEPYQSSYELHPLPEIIVTSPVGQTSNMSGGITNDSFVYPSPTLQLVNVPEGIDSSCYNLTLYELVNSLLTNVMAFK